MIVQVQLVLRPSLTTCCFGGMHLTQHVITPAAICRFVISPSSSVHLTMLSSLCTTREPTDNTSPLQTASTDTSPSSSRQHQTPLAYSLQLFDTAGAKEVTWGAEYKLVAEVVSAAGGDGRALLPSVQLQPGRYLVVLQLQPELGQQWVDSVTGATEPVPHWQVLLMPSLDEKVRLAPDILTQCW